MFRKLSCSFQRAAKKWKKRKQSTAECVPVPVLPRPRELSIFPESESDRTKMSSRILLKPWRRHEPNMRTQTKGLSFLDLPFEIRRLIIEEAIGGDVIHIVRLEEPVRAGHVRCPPGGLTDWGTPSYHQGISRACMAADDTSCFHDQTLFDLIKRKEENPNSTLSLLQSCRQLYTESMSVLYETNIFDIVHPRNLSLLQRSILPIRFENIRHLQIMWRIGYRDDLVCERTCQTVFRVQKEDFPTWEMVYDIIGTQMKGLRSLRLLLNCVFAHLFICESVERSLEVLKQKVRGLDTFTLDTPGPLWDVTILEEAVSAIICRPQTSPLQSKREIFEPDFGLSTV